MKTTTETGINQRRKNFANAVLIALIIVHLVSLLGFYTGISWTAFVAFLGLYIIRGLGITMGYHRYFAHKSFKTNRFFQFILGLMGSMAVQGGILWWVSHHREHHRYTETEDDIHSPVAHGFWQSHIGWLTNKKAFNAPKIRANDFAKIPEIKFLQKQYVFIQVLQVLGLFSLGSYLQAAFPQLETSGAQLLVWGFFINTVALWHSTFAVNSICHVWGKEPYEANDTSKNNFIVALLAFGEGWHNNHHKFATSARHGLEWWQFDMTFITLRFLEAFGIVSHLKIPTQEQLAAKRQKNNSLKTSYQMEVN